MKTNAIGIKCKPDVQRRVDVYSYHPETWPEAMMIFGFFREVFDDAAQHLVELFRRIPQFLRVLTKGVFLYDNSHSKLIWIRCFHTERNLVRHKTLLPKCHLPDS